MPQYKSDRQPPSPTGDAGDLVLRLPASRTAVVVIDMINHQLTPGRCFLAAMESVGTSTGYVTERVQGIVVPKLQRLLGAARAAGCMIAYVRVGSADGSYADTNDNVRPMMQAWGASDGAWPCEVIDALRPEPGDLSLMKAGSSAFTAASLDAQLKAAGIDTVVSVGVVTDGCVLLTAGAAFDLGYVGFVVADCTATFSSELQAAAELLIGNFMARVISTDDFVAALV